jgi:aryl-alcohol dehydrogenase-like predicted oxidoreductase
LGGVLDKPKEGRRADMDDQIESNRPKLEAWEGLCRELGHAPGDAALAWLLHNPVVTGPIIGPRTLQQLDGALNALDIKFSEETLTKIDEIFPGYKPAPEGYAW